MFDADTLRPVIVSMVIYIVLVNLVPRLVKKPTGVKVLDDVVLLLISQKGSIMSGTILTGLIVYLTGYFQEYIGESGVESV
jgi:hypothetical protein